VEVATLGQRDELLRDRLQPLGAVLGRGDALVLEQRGGQVGQHEPLVRGAATQTGTLGGCRHDFS